MAERNLHVFLTRTSSEKSANLFLKKNLSCNTPAKLNPVCLILFFWRSLKKKKKMADVLQTAGKNNQDFVQLLVAFSIRKICYYKTYWIKISILHARYICKRCCMWHFELLWTKDKEDQAVSSFPSAQTSPSSVYCLIKL